MNSRSCATVTVKLFQPHNDRALAKRLTIGWSDLVAASVRGGG